MSHQWHGGLPLLTQPLCGRERRCGVLGGFPENTEMPELARKHLPWADVTHPEQG